MNTVILMGRLTRDPEVRYSQEVDPVAMARYALAVDRKYKSDGGANTDFINCIAFRKNAEFAEKYLCKGMKIVITGRLQAGKYTNQEGRTVYTTDVVVESQEFAESKKSQENRDIWPPAGDGGFPNIPDSLDEGLPFF